MVNLDFKTVVNCVSIDQLVDKFQLCNGFNKVTPKENMIRYIVFNYSDLVLRTLKNETNRSSVHDISIINHVNHLLKAIYVVDSQSDNYRKILEIYKTRKE